MTGNHGEHLTVADLSTLLITLQKAERQLIDRTLDPAAAGLISEWCKANGHLRALVFKETGDRR